MLASRNLSFTGRQGSLNAVAALQARCSSSKVPMQACRAAGEARLSASSCSFAESWA